MPEDPSIAATSAEVARAAGTVKAAVLLAEDESRRTASQRKVNLIWESTQATIAISVTVATLCLVVTLALRVQFSGTMPTDVAILFALILVLSSSFFLVSGFYFGRTNHEKRGGVGADQSTTTR